MQGLDKTMSQSEVDSLNKFISENSMNFKGSIFELFDLLNSDMSIDDFKQKILEQKDNKENLDKVIAKNKINSEQENDETFKAIKGESQNKETYQNKDTNEPLKKLLENKFNLSKELEILFGVKIDDKDVNNNDFTKIFSNANLHNIKSVDLKA